MRKSKIFALGLMVVAMVALAGGLVASNMGFKLNFALDGNAAAGSKSGTNYVSIPYNPQVGVVTAGDLFRDIKDSGGQVASVQRHVRTTDQFQQYTFGTGDFSLTAGEGLIVKMDGGTFNYIIVGSHNPSATVTLEGSPVGGSKSGTNYYSHPYHATSATAQALFLEVGSGVSGVQRHVRATDQFQQYTFGTGDYALTPGDAYIIKLDGGASATFTPAHY